jgi:death-on-curing protein
MSDPVWVLPEVVIAVHKMLLAEHGGLSGMRDPDLLDSALARPKQRAVCESNVSLFELASSYSFGLVRNHPFVDGNKRIAFTIATVFLELNGFTLNAPEPEAVLMYEQLAASAIDERVLSQWLERYSSAKD